MGETERGGGETARGSERERGADREGGADRLKLRVSHKFVVEKVEAKRAFLLQQFSPEHTFADVTELLGHTATDVITGARVRPPSVDIFWAGFSCKSRSRANPFSKNHVNCLQQQSEAETSVTFVGVMGYIKQCRPRCVLLDTGVLQRERERERKRGRERQREREFFQVR